MSLELHASINRCYCSGQLNFLSRLGDGNTHLCSSESPSSCMQTLIGVTPAANLSVDTDKEHIHEVRADIQSGLSNLVTSTKQVATLQPDSDGVSDVGTVHQHPWSLQVAYPLAWRSHEEKMNHEALVSDRDGGGEFFDKDNPLSVDTRESQPRILIDEGPEDVACSDSVGSCQDDLCPVISLNEHKDLAGTVNVVSTAQCLGSPTKCEVPADCVNGDLDSTVQVAPEKMQIMFEARTASSSHASIMHSDDENIQESQKGRCKMVFRDLEAGRPSDCISSVDEEGMHDVEFLEDCKASSLVVPNEAVSVEACGHHAAFCDVKALVDSELREPLLSHVQTDDTKSSQDKEVLLSGENKLGGGDSLEKEAEVHGLRRRRGAKVDAVKPSVGGDSGGGKMPEEEKRVTATHTKDASTDSGQEIKQKSMDKKTGKQAKGLGKPSTVKNLGDSQPSEELRAKEDAETNRKVHESLDNFIRQTIRCEPYMNFTARPGEKPLNRLRSDVLENHVAGKFARGFKVDNVSDPRDIVAEESLGMDSYSNDADGLKDASNSSVKGFAGLGRGSQHSLKVPPGVVAFTQAAAKGTDWLSPSKITMIKCEKCAREFCSTLNYRRHVRVHRRSMNHEKEDLSKERSKVAAFWDKVDFNPFSDAQLTPEEATSIVHYENMEIEDLSGQSALKALTIFMQQPGLPSLPQTILRAGELLLDIAQNKSTAFPLSSERLLNILDDASERTFLYGGTSVAVQRFVFNGDAGKVGLEEKNLVASMGFHIELKLVKAWMADKEAEALRCQQALFKEEEAAQQKRAKLLEKKRMKKIRQKERKGSAPQLILQELENESIDDEGNIQGIGEEDDSPTATGSSSSSLASVHDLAFTESAELDMAEDIAQTDASDELVLGEEPAMAKSMLRNEDQMHYSHDEHAQYGRESSQLSSHQESSESGKEDPSSKESMEKREANSLLRPADQEVWYGGIDVGLAHPSSQSRYGRPEVQSSLYYRKGEQERVGSDFKRREFDKSAVERKPLRITRDRPRNDYSESVPKLGRDLRGFDGRYGEGSQTTYKPPRKPNVYFVKGDGGNSDLSNISRVQQYRRNLSGMSRALPTAGNAQVVWTRKVPQPAAVEATKDRKDAIQDGAGDSKVTTVDGLERSKESPEIALTVSDSAGRDLAAKLDKEGMEKVEDAASPVPLEVSTGNRITLPASSTSVSFHVDVSSEDWPRLPQRSGSNYSLGTCMVTKSASLDSSASIPREEHVEFVSQISEGDSGTIVGPCSDGSSGLMKTTFSSVRLQDSRLAGSGDDVISAEEVPKADEGLSGALLVGSLSVPLGKFATVSVSQSRSGSYALPHQPDDSEVTNGSSARSQDQSLRVPATQEVELSLGRDSASDGPEDSDPLGEEGLGSPVRVPGTRPQLIAIQTAKLKPHVSLSSPERGDIGRYNASLLAHERLAGKQVSWQTSVGRYVSAKVWRAVGMVGERHDTSTPVAGGEYASSCIDDRPLQEDVDISGSESEQEVSPRAEVRHLSPTQEGEFVRDNLFKRHDYSDDQAHVVNSNIGKDRDDQSFPSAPLDSTRSVGSGSDLPYDGRIDKALSDSGIEAAVLASGLCSLSVFVEVAGTFFNERWRKALQNASEDEVLVLATESVPEGAEGITFLDRVLLQLSNVGTRHLSGAESLPLTSSVLTESLGNPAHDAGLLLSRIFSDSDQTGVEDVRSPLITDERALDGAGAEDSGFPQALSSEDDVTMRDASFSPVDSENYMSGSETNRSTVSSAPFGGEEQLSESRGGGSGGGGGAWGSEDGGSGGSSHARWGNSRQERWNRNARCRFPDQRYMPRRRAQLEKNC